MRSSPIAALAGILLFFALAAPPLHAGPTREAKDDLTWEFAQFRRAQVKDIAYDLEFDFQKGARTFEGRATLHVDLNLADAPLSVDLTAESIHAIHVNGAAVTDTVRRPGSFDIPAAYLRAGGNVVEVRYTGAYSTTGMGLCHVVDPVDGKEYFYTNLEPYGAHRVFPCLDQPDIKATYSARVSAPADWRVIGNEPVASGIPDEAPNLRRIGTTPRLSTYLFFVGGGEYEAWFDEHKGTPLAIYARASLVPHVDAERLFAETKAGLDYFNDYFETPHPFTKYDHIFAPDLRPGAMENPGAVTMNESMIFRGPATADRYRSRNNTLLHEMAHMWFGNLVTMEWWNDLWLNESFATFSAYQAQAAMGAPDTVWRDFYDLKGWAYYQDQLSTTHPIETEVPSAELATANFDGITYAKGASALKQLAFFVGEEAYRRGVANYFRRHAWQNTTRSQFIGAIAEAAGTNLDGWTEAWLKTEGLSTMAVTATCEGGTLASAMLGQAPYNAPYLSPHKTQIATFRLTRSGALALERSEPLVYEGAETPIPWLAGESCPDLIYPNYGDMDYGLFFLDERSFETAMAHLSRLEDPLTRQMVWGTLFSMVRHGRLAAVEMMEVIRENLPREDDVQLLDYLVGGGHMRQLFYDFLTPAERDGFAAGLEDLLWTRLEESGPETDERLIWHSAYVRFATRPESRERLESLLADGGLDQQRRWPIIRKLTALGTPGMKLRIATELKRDPTDQGRRETLACRAAIPNVENKHAHWKRLTDSSASAADLHAVAGAFHNALRPELTEPFTGRWLVQVLATDWEAEHHRIRTWFDPLFPRLHTPEAIAENRRALNASRVAPRARRAWREALDRAELIVAVRNHGARSQSNTNDSSNP